MASRSRHMAFALLILTGAASGQNAHPGSHIGSLWLHWLQTSSDIRVKPDDATLAVLTSAENVELVDAEIDGNGEAAMLRSSASIAHIE